MLSLDLLFQITLLPMLFPFNSIHFQCPPTPTSTSTSTSTTTPIQHHSSSQNVQSISHALQPQLHRLALHFEQLQCPGHRVREGQATRGGNDTAIQHKCSSALHRIEDTRRHAQADHANLPLHNHGTLLHQHQHERVPSSAEIGINYKIKSDGNDRRPNGHRVNRLMARKATLGVVPFHSTPM